MSCDGLDAPASGWSPGELRKVGVEGEREGGAAKGSLGPYIRVIKGFVSYGHVFFICMNLRNDCWISGPKTYSKHFSVPCQEVAVKRLKFSNKYSKFGVARTSL